MAFCEGKHLLRFLQSTRSALNEVTAAVTSHAQLNAETPPEVEWFAFIKVHQYAFVEGSAVSEALVRTTAPTSAPLLGTQRSGTPMMGSSAKTYTL